MIAAAILWPFASCALGYVLCRAVVHPLVERVHAAESAADSARHVVGMGVGASEQDKSVC
jgi:hypothetical protein